MMPEPREADDVDAVLLLARCAVADLDETVDVYRRRDQQFLEFVPVRPRLAPASRGRLMEVP
jgi:hypothetical protein